MARLVVLLGLCLALWLPAAPAQALYKFGTEDQINRIQDVKLKGKDNEELFLGYIVRTHWFILGYNVEDRGYVLGIPGGGKRYYEMPTGDDLARFQRNGYLPDPLPRYSLSFFDYLFGYSDWWCIPLIGLLIWVGDRRKKAKAVAETAGSTPVASAAMAGPMPPTLPASAGDPPPIPGTAPPGPSRP